MLFHTKRPLELEDHGWFPTKRFATTRCVDDMRSHRVPPTFEYFSGGNKRARDEDECMLEPPTKRPNIQPFDGLNIHREQIPNDNLWNFPVQVVTGSNDPQVDALDIEMDVPPQEPSAQTPEENLVISPTVLKWLENQPPARWLQPREYPEAYGAIIPYQDPRETIGQSFRAYGGKMVVED